jgi:O-antigen/teichoic acid export membrane protein
MNPATEPLSAAWAAGAGRRVAKNSAWLFAGRLGSQGLAMLLGILIARRLGESGLGEYAFLTSVVFLGNLGSTFGTDMLIIRELAARRDFGLLPAALVVQLGLSLPLIAAAFLFAPALPNQSAEAIRALQWYSLALIPLAVYSVASSALRGIERMDVYTWLNVASGAILLALGAAFVRSDSTALTLAAVLLAAQSLAALLAAGLCAAYLPQSRNMSLRSNNIVSVLRLSAPIAVLGVLGALYQRGGIYLLSLLQGAALTGVFSAALRIVEAAKIGHIAVLSALFPAMSQAPQSEGRAYGKIFSASLFGLLGFAALLAAVLFAAARPLVTLLYGSEFNESASALRWLAWMLVPMTISHYLSLRLLAAARESAIMLALAASTLLLAALIVAQPGDLDAVGQAAVVAECVQAAILVAAWARRRRN